MAETGPKDSCARANRGQKLLNVVHGRNRLEFGTVRPRVQIPDIFLLVIGSPVRSDVKPT